jgi:transposase
MSTDATSSSQELPSDLAACHAIILQQQATISQKDATISQKDATIAQFAQTNVAYQQTIEQQGHRILLLLRRQYGPRREHVDPSQLTLFTANELEALAQEVAAPPEPHPTIPDAVLPEQDAKTSKKGRKTGHGRRRLPANLPREQIVHELIGDDLNCPCCGKERCEFSRQSSDQLEYIPPQFKMIEHVQVKYVCKACEENVVIAPKPPQPIEKGLPGPGLLAYVVLGKYGDHLPLYRLEDQTSRFGFTIRRSTQCDWISSVVDLVFPLYMLLCSLVRKSRIIHTDDTTVPMIVPQLGKTITARFWAYIGDKTHPYTVYDFTDSRKRDGPANFLQGFRGYLQADAYGGYDGIFTGSNGGIIEVGCNAHARRYWFDAKASDPVRAHHALGVFARLYQIETLCEEMSDDARRDFRQQHALPIWSNFRTWLDEQSPRLLPKSPIGQAATYTNNQWNALVRYCEDGELTIDNNESERDMKPPAIGRKNWLFVGNHDGGVRAAVLFSLVMSCKANGVEPSAYLTDLFTQLPNIPADRPDLLAAFLPDRWLAAHPQHCWTIDTIRRQERKQKNRC